MNITFRQLRVFIAVAQERSFSRAAEAMHLTQPAVSRYIRELEDELRLRLFDRTTREVVPTAVGLVLQTRMRRLLDEFESTLLDITSEHAERHGRVRVASAPTLSSSLMPACLTYCKEHYPNITLLMNDQVQSRVLSVVHGGQVDFGLVVDPLDDDDLHLETVLEDPFYLACRQDHPLARCAEVDWSSLARESLVLLDETSGSRPLINREFVRRGIDAHVAQEVGHPTTVFRLVDAGMGVSVLPGLAWPAPQGSRIVRVSLNSVVRRRITLVRRRGRTLSPAAQVVWKLILQRFVNGPDETLAAIA